MLKFSKDEDLNVKPCDFIKLIKSAIQTVRPQADQQQISIIVKTDEQLKPVLIDPEKMQDVVMNLLINAIEAVEPKTGQIVVRAEVDDKTQYVILRISDNGPGIEDTSAIFEPFYSTKDNVGAGLGLAIVRNIVQKHGGTLEVESLPQKGSTFTVCISVKIGP
jgi:two-component system sensor histidine kinase HydH